MFFLSQSVAWRPLPGPQECKGTEICQAPSTAEGSLILKDIADPFPRLASRKLESFLTGTGSQRISIAPSLLDSRKHSPLGASEVRRGGKKDPQYSLRPGWTQAG